jgi:hypothetical protein
MNSKLNAIHFRNKFRTENADFVSKSESSSERRSAGNARPDAATSVKHESAAGIENPEMMRDWINAGKSGNASSPNAAMIASECLARNESPESASECRIGVEADMKSAIKDGSM